MVSTKWFRSGLAFCSLLFPVVAEATVYQANPTNYNALLASLKPGDTLSLAGGTYPLLSLSGLNGTPTAWITITGPSAGTPATIVGSACCNTVEIANSSYLAIENLTIDSQSIDDAFGISAHGANNITHDILIQNNVLIGQDGSQQTDGISTKIPTWNWTIRNNTITGAGTGLYLGNSDGTDPFVAGLIENNLIQNTIGYNMEIKYQIARPVVPGMPTGPSTTIVRNNVFIKNDQASPDGDRPNVLLGGFPSTGAGSSDMYEVYGNFFYYNPREALLQVEGQVSVHDNILVDGQYTAMDVSKSDAPLNIAYIYNNTIYTSAEGILFGNLAAVADNVTGNLVFAASPISGPIANLSNNIVDTLANAVKHVNAPSFTLGTMNFYPLPGQAQGPALNLSPFASEIDYGIDFNGTPKNAGLGSIVFRGAYAGQGTNPGWQLQDAVKPLGAAPGPAFEFNANSSEFSGITNGSVVTPTIAPAGLSGTVIVRGAGSVSFSPVVNGDGVAFEGISSPNTNTAFVSFSGTPVGGVFNVSQGDLTFYVKSSYSFAQRQALGPGNYREVFDVWDGAGELFYFNIFTSGGRLIFQFKTASRANSGYYYVPVGQEDATFGLGVVAKFRLTWNGASNAFYLNGAQVANFTFTPATPNWSASSNFTIGATALPLYGGGYYKCDDPVAGFLMVGTGLGNGSPAVSLSPGTLTFANQYVGTTSNPAQSVTLSNTGTGPLTFSSIVLAGANPGDFAETNNCGAGIAAGGSCTFSVTFTPTEVGTRSASITITDNAAGSPHSIGLSGTGVAVVLGVSTLVCTPSTVISGSASSCTVTLTGAPSVTTAITLSSGNTAAFTVPAIVNVPATQTSATFSATAATVTSNQTSVITASLNSISAMVTLTAQPAGGPTFYLRGTNAEILGTVNGSSVVPTNAPAGLTGSLVVRGTGSIMYSPVVNGDGVAFEGISSPNSNTAFVSFSGAPVGSVFNPSQGTLTFSLKSSYSFAQRQALGSSNYRQVFDVFDATGELFYFDTFTSGGRLIFQFKTGSRSNSGYYYVPAGQEDAMFGLGVVANFMLTWNGSTNVLYLNGTQVATFAYTTATPNWGAASNFAFGATAVPLYGGGYYKCDDPIADFQIR